jgi:hypothetical protein
MTNTSKFKEFYILSVTTCFESMHGIKLKKASNVMHENVYGKVKLRLTSKTIYFYLK